MTTRLERLRKWLSKRNLEALLVTHPVNRRYLTGFTGSSGWVLVTGDRQVLISDFRYTEQGKEESPHFSFVDHGGNLLKEVARLCREAGVSTLAFEEAHLTVRVHRQLMEALEGVELRPVVQVVEELRQIKSEDEVAIIRQAASIVDTAFEKILEKIKPGVTEREIESHLEILMRKQGATSSSFDIIVASGPRSALPHGVASDRVMQRGDLVTLDFGALYQGYCSDMTRTVVLGPPADWQREIYGIVLEAQQKAVAAIRPGITGQEVDTVARDHINANGYGDQFGHSTGHGLGMEVHEAPTLSIRGKEPLEPGMVVTVEPGIYLPGRGGVRIEDDVCVTENGYEGLTFSPKELIILD
ncbi:M24 family metallopeptidase [Desmospora profundinema]|uniref:Xaa-Pro aminopeptidase n=1 Tax=Desmospora profundinema TaxID=1571184 RepID=A0ABU1IIS4_9BACL|nr:Xaa-Pro peptidase family protein [Desmospora profundinema]MDR6224670.1 Xaa-Pro aminopeptidase [Desmospora profundinema]